MFPSVVIQIDDSSADMYNKFFPILSAKNMVGSLSLRTSIIGQASQITDAQATEMYNVGWSINNHTNQDEQLPNLTNEQIITAIQSSIDYFTTKGWLGSERDLIVPQDKVTDAILPTIASLCRTCDYNSDNYGWNSETTDKYYIRRKPSTNQTLATIKGNVDTAIANGTNVVIMFHKIAETTSDLFYSESEFIEFIDYIASKRDAGLIAVKTYKELCDYYSTSTLTIKTS